ncbi:hypothetical protein D917_09209 [Trichinella nativa]|uniref:Uncharacterized protein n=1 Tax=Trichinella nativa TaxID=6335 RepID=A0A1Y3ELA1_9BILA|nr:hypothetical protein D917_09209 [Trichinella nativa]
MIDRYTELVLANFSGISLHLYPSLSLHILIQLKTGMLKMHLNSSIYHIKLQLAGLIDSLLILGNSLKWAFDVKWVRNCKAFFSSTETTYTVPLKLLEKHYNSNHLRAKDALKNSFK